MSGVAAGGTSVLAASRLTNAPSDLGGSTPLPAGSEA